MSDSLVQPRFEITTLGVDGQRSTSYGWAQVRMQRAIALFVLTATMTSCAVPVGTSNQGDAVVTYTRSLLIIEATTFDSLLAAWNSVAQCQAEVMFPELKLGRD